MSIQDGRTRDEQRAWDLLAAVEKHPQVEEWLEEVEALGKGPSPLPLSDKGRVIKKWLAAAASVMLAVGLGAGAYFYFAPLHYETRIGEQRDVRLPDGSTVTLNTDTALTVRYSDKRRYIELERGEALFAVKHNTTQPFDVAAGDTLTRALGTEFNVDMRNSKVTVSVLDGAVRVAAANVAPGTATIESSGDADEPGLKPIAALAKGQALEFHAQDRRVLEEKADLRRIDAWRTRRLEFTDTPLAEAVEEFNRYSTTRVVVGTSELGEVHVSGVFRIGDAEGFLFSLREALHVETHESGEEIVLLRMDP